MKLFLDSANIKEIEELGPSEYIYGLTTNPTFFYEEGVKSTEEFLSILKDIMPDKEIQLEAMGSVDEILKIARDYVVSPSGTPCEHNIVSKIPFNEDGLEAVSILSKESIKTNVHLVYSVNQAVLAARSGATYVCPLMGRFDDSGQNSSELLGGIKTAFDNYDIKTEILAASVRHPDHVKQALLLGVDAITIPYKVFKLMMDHPLTERGTRAFEKHTVG
jgi:transaldolase